MKARSWWVRSLFFFLLSVAVLTPTECPAQDFRSVHFADARHGWVVGDNLVGFGSLIVATSDGGATWKRQQSGTSENLSSVHFADSRHGWAAGDGGTILSTSDGGGSWRAQPSGT